MTVYALMQYEDSDYAVSGVGTLQGVFATREEAAARFDHFIDHNRIDYRTGRLLEYNLLIEFDTTVRASLAKPVVAGAMYTDGKVLKIIQLEMLTK